MSTDRQNCWAIVDSFPGERISFRVWGGKLINGKVVRRFPFMRQVVYVQASRWDYPDPWYYSVKVSWLPFWRIYD